MAGPTQAAYKQQPEHLKSNILLIQKHFHRGYQSCFFFLKKKIPKANEIPSKYSLVIPAPQQFGSGSENPSSG